MDDPVQHADLQSGDAVHVRGIVTDTMADYIRVVFGDHSLSQVVYVPREQIVCGAGAELPHHLREALLGRHGRILAA